MIYLLDGTESYQIKLKKDSLLKKSKVLAENVHVMDGSTGAFRLSDALTQCSTISFFGERRAVIIDSPYFLNAASRGSKTGEDPELLNRFCENPPQENDLYFYCPDFNANKGSRVYKILAAYFNQTVTHIHYEQSGDLRREACRLLESHGIQLSADALDELILRVTGEKGSTSELYKGIDKLVLYGHKNINRNDIRNLIPANYEINIFRFTNSFFQRDYSVILESLEQMVTIGRMNYTAIIAMTANYVKDCYEAVCLYENGMSMRDICSYTKKWYMEKRYNSCRGYSAHELLGILNDLARLDQGIKTGAVDAKEGFEQFLLRRMVCSH